MCMYVCMYVRSYEYVTYLYVHAGKYVCDYIYVYTICTNNKWKHEHIPYVCIGLYIHTSTCMSGRSY
jgi:hypothetical protein